MRRDIGFLLMVAATILFTATTAAHAWWPWDGVPICTNPEEQNAPAIVSNGSGGAVIAWNHYTSDVWRDDVYAQAIDASGNVLWPANGVAISTATYSQNVSAIVSDMAGGAIIVFRDRRAGGGSNNNDVYARRVDVNGTVQWITDGVPLSTAFDSQTAPTAISDGVGGAVSVWQSRQNTGYEGPYDIYAQRIDFGGTVQWATNGIAVCIAAGTQMAPHLTSDGSDGTIITWLDDRSGGYDIYAQKVDAWGNVGWTLDGVAVCTATGDQELPRIVSGGGSGGAIITWQDGRGGGNDIYAQRIDLSGAAQWTADGVVICSATGNQERPRIASDGSGGAIITWYDTRSGSYDIYAQRIDPSGAVQWLADGVAICSAAGDQGRPEVIADGSGGAVITWNDPRSGAMDVYAQKVNASGVIQWSADGVAICAASGDQMAGTHTPKLAVDGDGGAIITWDDDRGGDRDIYAMRVGDGLPPIVTLLQSFHASRNGSDITIEWTLSDAGEDMKFFILRNEAASMVFRPLSNTDIMDNGLAFSFTDRCCKPGISYRYRVEVKDEDGRRILFETEAVISLSMPLALGQNQPNPFNPTTRIQFFIDRETLVLLAVYDTKGRLVKTLVDRRMGPGEYSEEWNGEDNRGIRVASGIYFYRLHAGNKTLTRKAVLLK